MTPRTRISAVALLGVLLWLASRGRLSKVVQAAEAGGHGWGFGSSAGAHGTEAAPTGPSEGDLGALNNVRPISSSVFGFQAPFSGWGQDVSSGIMVADQAGLRGFGGGQLAGDFDYSAPAGTAVSLPKGETWSYLGDDKGPWGHLLGFRSSRGGVIEFAHASGFPSPFDPGASVGQQLAGGTPIEYSGGRVPQDVPSSDYSTGAHVAIIMDTEAYREVA